MAKLPGIYELMATAASPAINFGRGLLGYQDPFTTQTMQDRMKEIEGGRTQGNVGYEDYGLDSSAGRFTGGLMGLALNDPVNFGLAGSIGKYDFGPEGRKGLTYDFTPDQDTGSTGSAVLDFINEGGLKGALSRMGTAEAAEVTPNNNLQQRIDIANQFELPVDYSADDLQARAKRAMTQPGFSMQLEKNDPNIPDEIEFLDGQKFTATPYDPYNVNIAPTRSLGDVVMEARTNEPLDIEDFLGTSTPRDLGFIGNAPTIKEAVAPIGITDRGRGMATPGTMGAFEMIGGTPVAIGDKLGRQMALEKADYYEPPKSGVDLGTILSLGGLLSGSNLVKGLGMIANRDKIGRMAGNVRDRVSSGLGSLNRKMRGVNPDGTTRTQRQYEAAREQRRNDRRVEKMLERKAAGKSYSQKNLNKLTTGGSKPGTYTAKGGGSGGTSSKIVCTMMNERYGFGLFRNKIWMKFHENYGPEYQKGYHAIFLPLVKIAKGEGKINTAVRKVLEHMGRHVTADMFKIMKGKKRDPLGRIYRAIFEPTCRIIGKIKSALGRG